MSESQIDYAEKQPELDLGKEKAALEARLAQIKEIEAERAVAARSAALMPVLAAIRQHGFTAAELGMEYSGNTAKAEAYKAKKTDRRATIEPKYRDPIDGKEWAGRGKMPTWLAARIAGGHDASEFLIVKPAAPVSPDADSAQANASTPTDGSEPPAAA